MIIAAASTDDRYSGGDPYATDTQYRDTGPVTVSYGSEYGTGSYSSYSTSRGQYSSSVEITGYGTGESGTGYGYTAGGTDTGYGTISTASYRYGDGPDLQYDTAGAAFDYVIDVLDGDAESGSGDAEIYIPVEISR